MISVGFWRWRQASSVRSWSTVMGRWERVVRAAMAGLVWEIPTTALCQRSLSLIRNTWKRSHPPRVPMVTLWHWPLQGRCTAGGMVSVLFIELSLIIEWNSLFSDNMIIQCSMCKIYHLNYCMKFTCSVTIACTCIFICYGLFKECIIYINTHIKHSSGVK